MPAVKLLLPAGEIRVMCYGRHEASSVRGTDVDTVERVLKKRWKKLQLGLVCKYDLFKRSGYFIYPKF